MNVKQNGSKQMARSRRLPAGGLAAAALVAVLSAGLATTAQAAATTVTMGTAGQFAILAGSGLTNTGATTIGGDIGSYPTTSQTGFGPCPGAPGCVTTTGGTNEGGNAVTQTAKTDLTTAYNQAAGEKPRNAVSTIGTGKTLYAGVYNSASSIQLNGSLTLNGRGNKDAVFVFQAGSTLKTATSSSVNLVNGAQACNVFWQVGSSATLLGSLFQGTILAYDDISLGAAVTVHGRLLAGEQASQAGAVTLIHDTINVPTCAATPPPPPTTTTTAPRTTTTTSGAATTTTVATNHGNHHKTTGTTTAGGSGTTPGSSKSPSKTPKGAPQTGGGSTAGMHEMGLFGLGGALLLGGTSALVYRRRRPVS
jgi:hypothetical protein